MQSRVCDWRGPVADTGRSERIIRAAACVRSRMHACMRSGIEMVKVVFNGLFGSSKKRPYRKDKKSQFLPSWRGQFRQGRALWRFGTRSGVHTRPVPRRARAATRYSHDTHIHESHRYRARSLSRPSCCKRASDSNTVCTVSTAHHHLRMRPRCRSRASAADRALDALGMPRGAHGGEPYMPCQAG